jgi:hypothetical protein
MVGQKSTPPAGRMMIPLHRPAINATFSATLERPLPGEAYVKWN